MPFAFLAAVLSCQLAQALLLLNSALPALSATPGNDSRVAAAAEPPAEEWLARAATFVRIQRPDEALGSIVAGRKAGPTPDVAAALDVVEARALLLHGRPDPARNLLLPHTTSKRPGLAFWASWYLAKAEAAAGSFAEALRLMETVYPLPTGQTRLQSLCSTALDAAVALNDAAAAETWARRLANLPGVDRAAALTASVRAAALQAKKPESQCRKLLVDYPCAPVPTECTGLASVESLGEGSRFDRARNLFDCWGYTEAEAEFRRFLADPDLARFHTDAHFFLAEILARKLRSDRAEAFDHYKAVYDKGTKRKAYTLYQMGRCKMNLEDYDEAARLFRKYLSDHPRGEFAERCAYYEGWLPYDHGKYEQALKGFEHYLDRYRKGSLRSYVIWFKAWSLYRLGRFDKAYKAFDRLVPFGNDIMAGKALYWLGRTCQQMDRADEARDAFGKVIARYPLSYYSMMARKRLAESGTPVPNPVTASLLRADPPALPSDLATMLGGAELGGLDVVIDCLRVGETATARHLFSPLSSAYFDKVAVEEARARIAAAELLETPDELREWGSSHLRPRGSTPSLKNRYAWTAEYPLAYRRLVEASAALGNLPPWLLYSIMRQESRYRRGVVSWADAMGLMQIVPDTAARVAQSASIPFERSRLFEPEVNIRLAAAYLSALARDFHDQFILVAAAYNTGPVAIRQFVKSQQGQPLDVVIESIAYNEGRNYCRKVSGHLMAYLALYAPPDQKGRIMEQALPDPPRFDLLDTVGF